MVSSSLNTSCLIWPVVSRRAGRSYRWSSIHTSEEKQRLATAPGPRYSFAFMHCSSPRTASSCSV